VGRSQTGQLRWAVGRYLLGQTVPAAGLTSQAHVDAPLIGSATLNAEIGLLTCVSQLVESNKGAIFAARERLGTPDSLIRDKEKPGHQRGRRGF
jgi:hypothetical protein